ncbi:hypothetical protein MPSEU_000245200 [Mayamaea pseudoterrestris]|nr:hypothetical protein MPSEU_000245200 [Mayamaea pseudoterrestris]
MEHQLSGIHDSKCSSKVDTPGAASPGRSSEDLSSQRSSSSCHSNDGKIMQGLNALQSQRSNPIAIARSPANDPYYTSDDSDDEDANNYADNLRPNANAAQSLPIQLLRAPMLGSMPTRNSDHMLQSLNHNQTMLPPPMFLADQESGNQDTLHIDNNKVSYGSLRESHMRGKFLDGPASYRDRATGGIRQLHQHRVRFQGGELAASLPAQGSQFLSIGERMRSAKSTSATELSEGSTAFKKQGSLLGDMLQASPLLSGDDERRMEGRQSPPPFQLQPQSLYEPTGADFDVDNMLSTSLTALEVLQSRMLPSCAQVAVIKVDEELPVETRPRNELGHNTLMSRTLSDPMPHRQLQQAIVTDSSFVLRDVGMIAAGNERRTSNRYNNHGSSAELHRATSLASEETTYRGVFDSSPQNHHNQHGQTDHGLERGDHQAQEQHIHPDAFYPTASTLGSSPDVEGAFDMDLEL